MCTFFEAKGEFYRELSLLPRCLRSTDVVIAACDVNAKIGKIAATEQQFRGQPPVLADDTDNGDHLYQICSDHTVSGEYQFCYKTQQRLTWKTRFVFTALDSLMTLPSPTCGMEQLRIADRSGANLWTQIML